MLFQPPPTPAHVLRSLEYIAAHPHQEQKYAHVPAASAHISAYSNAGHTQAYSTGHAQAYSGGQAHVQAYNHNSYAHENTLTHQAAPVPYHHYK